MDLWTSHSQPGKKIALSAVCAGAGVALMIGFRDFSAPGANDVAGFLLGALLLAIGATAFLVTGRQTVVVDPGARRITIEDVNRFRSRKRLIPFADISSVNIGFLGKDAGHASWYFLVLRLANGEDCPLFAPGQFYEGGADGATVIGWKQRLEACLGSLGSDTP